MDQNTSKIKEKIATDLKIAMKEKDVFKRDALRLLNSAFKQVEVDERITLDDERVIKILKTAYKQREDAAIAYKNAGRDDLYHQESQEMALILQYLPEQLNDEQLASELKKIIASVGATHIKDIGKVMAQAKNLNADGRRISTMIKTLLPS